MIKDKGRNFAVIYYVNFGAPTIRQSQEMVRFYAAEGGKNIQLDLPSRDPYLENDFVLGRMEQCLATCGDLNCYLEGILELRKSLPDLEIEMTAYEDSLDELGLAHFLDFCHKASIQRFSYMPKRHNPDPALGDKLRAGGLALLAPIQSHLPEEAVVSAIQNAQPIQLLIEGPQPPRPGCEKLEDAIGYLRSRGAELVFATMGIRTPQRLLEVRDAGADGAYVGSRLMQAWGNPEELRTLLHQFGEAANGQEPTKE